ncbi:hypothetical protein KXV85_006001, partial [Aspergillus fumigatus]
TGPWQFSRPRFHHRRKSGNDHADRAHHCRLGFLRRRRYPGRSEDVCGARRLRRVRDHGADRTEHARRERHPPGAGGFRNRRDRCRLLRSCHRRGEDRHGGGAFGDRRDRSGPCKVAAEARRARSGDGRDLGRPSPESGC